AFGDYIPRHQRGRAELLGFRPHFAPDRGGEPAFMWITPAYAQAASPTSDLFSPSSPIWMMAIIFVIMYVLMIRPQQKKVKQHQEMVKNLRRGDSVITSGGTLGKVTKVVDDDQIEIEIAQGVRVRQMRNMVSEVRAKGEPVADDAAASATKQ